MTTIAVRDGVIAADSQATYATSRHQCVKLYRKSITEGRKTFDVVIATAGEVSPGLVFVDWYGTGKTIPEVLLHLGGDFLCLVLRHDGLFEVDVYCRPDRVIDYDRLGFYAIGSGSDAALGAMHAGKGAVEAVRIAARIDTYTGGKVESMTIDKPEVKPRSKRKPVA